MVEDLETEAYKRDTTIEGRDKIIDLQDQQIKSEKKLGKKKRNRWVKIAGIEGVLLLFILLL